jgi:hypothetical protein
MAAGSFATAPIVGHAPRGRGTDEGRWAWPLLDAGAAPYGEPQVSVELAPRSAYVLRGEARWRWQHSIAPTPGPRWSVTFRTPRRRDPSRSVSGP